MVSRRGQAERLLDRSTDMCLIPYVADIQEYLLLKGVEAVAIHGSKSELILSFYSPTLQY